MPCIFSCSPRPKICEWNQGLAVALRSASMGNTEPLLTIGHVFKRKITMSELDQMNPQEQIDAMEEWFRSNYEDPAQQTPYDSREGGYIHIWGGPYDALEELQSEFGGIVKDELIEQLANKLSDECSDWARIPDENDFDYDYLDTISSSKDTLGVFAV